MRFSAAQYKGAQEGENHISSQVHSTGLCHLSAIAVGPASLRLSHPLGSTSRARCGPQNERTSIHGWTRGPRAALRVAEDFVGGPDRKAAHVGSGRRQPTVESASDLSSMGRQTGQMVRSHWRVSLWG